MRIATTTPTGNVGRHVVEMLIRAGVRPLVLARHPDGIDPAVLREVDVVRVDQRDSDAVVAATVGVDALFWVDPPSTGVDPLADYDSATRSVVQAVKQNEIERVVFQSSVGAEKRHGVGEIDGLAATEVALDAIAPSVAHLRCGYFFTNLVLQLDAIRAGTISVTLPLDHPLPWVAPRDIAEVAVTRLLSNEWSGRCVQAVHGPVDLTWSQVADIVSDATGRRLEVESITDEQMREAMGSTGMSDNFIDAIIEMSSGLRDDFTPEQERTVRTTTPTTLGAWCYDVLRPQL